MYSLFYNPRCDSYVRRGKHPMYLKKILILVFFFTKCVFHSLLVFADWVESDSTSQVQKIFDPIRYCLPKSGTILYLIQIPLNQSSLLVRFWIRLIVMKKKKKKKKKGLTFDLVWVRRGEYRSDRNTSNNSYRERDPDVH